MLNIFVKFKCPNFCDKKIKISKRVVFFIFFFILKKNGFFFLFKSLVRDKKFTILQSPFHYKNSKKNIHSGTFSSFLILKTACFYNKKSFFFLKKQLFLNFGFLSLDKLKIRGYVKLFYFF